MATMLRRLRNSLYILLRQSERYTKTDMVYLAKGGLFSVGGTIVTTILSLVSVLAFANLLPREMYGTYQYILATADLFGIFVLSGIDVAVGRSVARGKEGSILQALWTKIKWGFVGGAMAITVGAYYLSQDNGLLGWGFIIAGLFMPFWEAPSMYGTIWQGKRRFDLISAGDFLLPLATIVFMVPALFFTDNILIILGIYFSTNLVARGAFLWATLRAFPPNNVKDPEMIPYGMHLTAMSAAGTVAGNTDRILLWHLLGPASVAIYTLAQAMPMRAIGFLKIINRLAFPKMVTQDPAQVRATLMPKVLLLVGLSTAGALAYALVAPSLFAIFLPQYLEAIPYTVLAALLIALQPFSLLSSSFAAHARKNELYIWSIGTPALRIALFLAFIPLWGLWGAMGALLGSKALESIILVRLFYRV